MTDSDFRIEGNKRIARYLGFEYVPHSEGEGLGFDCDWNMLIEAVHMVESEYIKGFGKFEVMTFGKSCAIYCTETKGLLFKRPKMHILANSPTKIMATYRAVLMFIAFKEENKEKTK